MAKTPMQLAEGAIKLEISNTFVTPVPDGYKKGLEFALLTLTNLLPTEREFAIHAFVSGQNYEISESEGDFNTFYSQYETE